MFAISFNWSYLAQLKELFQAYNPSTAKIALRPIPRFMVKKLQARGEPRKGRGFGFVSLGSEELQQKAVSEMNGKEVEGREIAVKVAIDSPGKEDIDPEAAGVEPLAENGVVQANETPATATAWVTFKNLQSVSGDLLNGPRPRRYSMLSGGEMFRYGAHAAFTAWRDRASSSFPEVIENFKPCPSQDWG